jgi:hypothetical protein
MNITAPECIPASIWLVDHENDPPTSELNTFQTNVAACASAIDVEYPGEITEPLAVNASSSAAPAPKEAAPLETATERDVTVGTTLNGRYVLKEILGRGGHSRVFRAEDLCASNRSVAIKVLLPAHRGNPQALTRLRREFEQMRRLSHPGIARVFELDCHGGVWFLSMEAIEGSTLTARVATLESLPQSLKLIVACGEALQHAHSQGILHGDLKPSNVLVTASGEIKLIDFGSAPALNAIDPASQEPSVAATACYASPQVLAGNLPDERDDVFSLACLSYVILSKGTRPFPHKDRRDHLPGAPPPYIRDIPVRLFDVIVRGLAPEREQRPASVADFLSELLGANLTPCAEPDKRVAQLPVVAGPRVIAPAPPRPIANLRWKMIGYQKWQRMPWGKAAAVAAAAGLIATVSQLPTRTQSIATTAPVTTQIASVTAPAIPPKAVVTPPVVAAVATQQPPVQRAVTSGVVTFESKSLTVPHTQALVAIPIRRLGSTRAPGLVAWTIDRGTARPNIDYKPEGRRVARFVEGQAVRSLFISLPNDRYAALKRGPRTFTVALRKVAGGSALGAVRRISVTIAPDPAAEPQYLQTAN